DLPADVAGLEAMALGGGNVDLDLDLRFLGLSFHAQIRDALDVPQGLPHLLRHAVERGTLRTIEAQDDGVVSPREHLSDLLAQIRLHVLGESGIAVDHSLNGGHRRLVVRLGIYAHPELAGIDPYDLVARHRTP